jgi:hypothetical protein
MKLMPSIAPIHVLLEDVSKKIENKAVTQHMTAVLVQNGFDIRPVWENYDVRSLVIEDHEMEGHGMLFCRIESFVKYRTAMPQ